MQLKAKVHLENPVSYRSHDLCSGEVKAAKDAIELLPVVIPDYDRDALEAFLTVVKNNKVAEIVVKPMNPGCYGSHGYQGNAGSIEVNGRLYWHKQGTYSTVAHGKSPIEVIQLTLVHEIGHFLSRRYESRLYEALATRLYVPDSDRKGVTEYARELIGEYYSETLVAVTLLPALRGNDPDGFDSVRQLLEAWAEE